MLGTVVNVLAVLVGGTIGPLIKNGLPERISDTVMKGLGLCTLYIGLTGALKGENTLVIIISVAAGALIGELADLDGRLIRLGELLEGRFKNNDSKTSVAEGFVSSSLLFCVGAMAIVGSLQSGLSGDHETLFTKSLLDGIAAILFASSFGIGVLFSSVFILLYQGSITLLASIVAPYLTDPVIAEMTCVGSLLIIGLALNMLKITRLKVMNYVPGIFIPIILCLFMS